MANSRNDRSPIRRIESRLPMPFVVCLLVVLVAAAWTVAAPGFYDYVASKIGSIIDDR